MTDKYSSRGSKFSGQDFPSRRQRRKHEKEQLQARAQANAQRTAAPLNPTKYARDVKPLKSSSKVSSSNGSKNRQGMSPSKLEPAGNPKNSCQYKTC